MCIVSFVAWHWYNEINPLTPNDLYRGHYAPLTSNRCILYIYSSNIGTEYLNTVYTLRFFSLRNAICFIILTHLVSVLFTFYIHGVLKLKRNNSGAKRSTDFYNVLYTVSTQQYIRTVIQYTGCNRRNGPDFGRVFLMLNYTDITQNTYIQSWKVTDIMAIEMCGLLGCRRTVRRPWSHTCTMCPPARDMIMQ